MIYVALWIAFNLGLFVGFWLAAVLATSRDADDDQYREPFGG